MYKRFCLIAVLFCSPQTFILANRGTDQGHSEVSPQELKSQLTWGLLNLHEGMILSALKRGADAYSLDEVINGKICCNVGLSPYAVILMGLDAQYTTPKNTVKDFTAEQMQAYCNDMCRYFELLMKKNISVDRGHLGSHDFPDSAVPLRIYIKMGLENSRDNKNLTSSQKVLLESFQKIQELIEKYQPVAFNDLPFDQFVEAWRAAFLNK